MKFNCSRFRAALLSSTVWLCFSVSAYPEADENSIRSAYLYNFAKFVEWPESAFDPSDSHLNLCVAGTQSVLASFSNLQGKQVKGRSVRIVNLNTSMSTDVCQILYIGQSEEWRLKKILALFNDRPLLSVSEMKGFAENGGVINLVWDDRKSRFIVNTGITEQVGLKISAQLLRLASGVSGEK